ncbi:MAG: FAD-binding oxidoreductase [Rhodospirillales bacterium]
MPPRLAIAGGGMAGFSLAAALAGKADVVLLERESQPGYHTTGRSAAVYAPAYGNRPIRAVTAASRSFYEAPPEGFSDHPLLTPLDVVFIGRADQRDSLAGLIATASDQVPDIGWISPEEACRAAPVLRADYVKHAVRDPSTSAMDVGAILQGYVRQAKSGSVEIRTSSEITSAERRNDAWRIRVGDGVIEADVLVNAAGAWADRLAGLAGAAPLGLAPLRRTAMTLDVPDSLPADGWSMVVDADEQFYLKPEAGALLASPADETPSEPCDAQADEMDVAICVDRIERATTLQVRRVRSRWAGLRTFAPDRTPVVGFDPDCPGFFWLAGQGGYGIQTAPALAEIAAALVLGQTFPQRVAAFGLSGDDLSPARFTRT